MKNKFHDAVAASANMSADGLHLDAVGDKVISAEVPAAIREELAAIQK